MCGKKYTLCLSFIHMKKFLIFILHFLVKPVAVHILAKEKFVSADKRIDVECKSSGSKPEAMITWHKSARQLKRMSKNVSISKYC